MDHSHSVRDLLSLALDSAWHGFPKGHSRCHVSQEALPLCQLSLYIIPKPGGQILDSSLSVPCCQLGFKIPRPM